MVIQMLLLQRGPSNYTISQYGNAKGTWESLYAIIATTNTLISAVEGSSAFAGFATQDGPSELSQIYGEAVACVLLVIMN